jgi:hypothetical protein
MWHWISVVTEGTVSRVSHWISTVTEGTISRVATAHLWGDRVFLGIFLVICAGGLAIILFRKRSAPPELAKLEASIAELSKSVEAFKNTLSGGKKSHSTDAAGFLHDLNQALVGQHSAIAITGQPSWIQESENQGRLVPEMPTGPDSGIRHAGNEVISIRESQDRESPPPEATTS